MQSLKHFLTHNWFAKLFSLLLATMLWVTIASETSSEIVLDVPIQYRNMPPELEVTSETTNSVQVRLRGSANLIRELSPQNVSVTSDFASVSAGDTVVQLTPQNVQAPLGIQVVRVNPARVRLTLERTISKMVPVTPSVSGEPAPGYEVQEVSVVPQFVGVQGPESRVRDLLSIPTIVLDISGAKGDVQQFVDLGLTVPFVRLQHLSPVDIQVRVAEQTAEGKVTATLDPALNTPRVSVRPAVVEVTFEGPQSKVLDIDPEALYFTLDWETLPPGEHNVEPTILGIDPESIEITQITPDTVTVTIRNR